MFPFSLIPWCYSVRIWVDRHGHLSSMNYNIVSPMRRIFICWPNCHKRWLLNTCSSVTAVAGSHDPWLRGIGECAQLLPPANISCLSHRHASACHRRYRKKPTDLGRGIAQRFTQHRTNTDSSQQVPLCVEPSWLTNPTTSSSVSDFRQGKWLKLIWQLV